jgi:hypothetical protein
MIFDFENPAGLSRPTARQRFMAEKQQTRRKVSTLGQRVRRLLRARHDAGALSALSGISVALSVENGPPASTSTT